MSQRNRRVETWLDKQVFFDKSSMIEDTEGETDAYTVHCFTPSERWFLHTLVSFYPVFVGRWSDDWTNDEREELYSKTVRRLICQMACETDILRIADALEGMLNESVIHNARMQGLINEAQDIETVLDQRLENINDTLVLIKDQINSGIFPNQLIDQVEFLLNGIAVILGAPAVPILP